MQAFPLGASVRSYSKLVFLCVPRWATCPATYKPLLWKELSWLSTDTFLALVAQRVRELQRALEEPSERERAWIELLVLHLQAHAYELPYADSEDIVREGRNRTFLTQKNVRELGLPI